MYQNRVSIIGFVGNDAQPRSTKIGASVASILKLDRAERQEDPAPNIEPTDDPA